MAHQVRAQLDAEASWYWRCQFGEPSIDGYRRWIVAQSARNSWGFKEQAAVQSVGNDLVRWRELANYYLIAEAGLRVAAIWGPASSIDDRVLATRVAWAGFRALSWYELSYEIGTLSLRGSPVDRASHRVLRFLDLLHTYAGELLQGPPTPISPGRATRAIARTLQARPDLQGSVDRAMQATHEVIVSVVESSVAMQLVRPDDLQSPAGSAARLEAAATPVAAVLALGTAVSEDPFDDEFREISGLNPPSIVETAWSIAEFAFDNYLPLAQLDDQRYGPNHDVVVEFLGRLDRLQATDWVNLGAVRNGSICAAPGGREALPIGGANEPAARSLGRSVAYNAAGRAARKRTWDALAKIDNQEAAARRGPSLLSRLRGDAWRQLVEADQKRLESRLLRAVAAAQACAALVLRDVLPTWEVDYEPFARVIPAASLSSGRRVVGM